MDTGLAVFVTMGSGPTVPSTLWVLVSTPAPGLVSAQVSSASQLSGNAPYPTRPALWAWGHVWVPTLHSPHLLLVWGALGSRRHMSIVWWIALRVH